MKEAIKRLTNWAAYYYTSRKSWYPNPENSILLSQIPVIKSLKPVDMNRDDITKLREWAKTYGAAVRQRTVRQETTMAKHGSLPEYIYKRQCTTSDEPVKLLQTRTALTLPNECHEGENGDDEDDVEHEDDVEGVEHSDEPDIEIEEPLEYDPDSSGDENECKIYLTSF